MKRIVTLTLGTLLFLSCGAKEEKDFVSMDFPSIIEEARGSELSFSMWGGSPTINNWVENYVGGLLEERYGITLNMVPINDAAEFIKKLSTEKAAGLKTGSTDLVWINGENFKNARQEELLYGPYTALLPNMEKHVEESSALYDFGFPVEGYETPYGKAQFVFEYDSAILTNPPASFAALKTWLVENPGRFTYPQPPDFTGSAFIRQVFYEVSGGADQFLKGFNEALLNEKAPLLWAYLNEIKPYLWQDGESYPKTITVQETLFARGELDFSMSYTPSHATGKILEGLYPDTVRTFVMEGNSISNTHYTAIPYNAPNKAAALVLSNLLISPEVQADKAIPENWGDLSVLDYARLGEEEKAIFDAIPLGVATLPLSALSSNAVPEIPSAYVELLERGWEENVLGR